MRQCSLTTTAATARVWRLAGASACAQLGRQGRVFEASPPRGRLQFVGMLGAVWSGVACDGCERSQCGFHT